MHLMSNIDLTREEHTITFSKDPRTIMTVNGTIRTTEQAIVCVKDLDMFVSVLSQRDSLAWKTL